MLTAMCCAYAPWRRCCSRRTGWWLCGRTSSPAQRWRCRTTLGGRHRRVPCPQPARLVHGSGYSKGMLPATLVEALPCCLLPDDQLVAGGGARPPRPPVAAGQDQQPCRGAAVCRRPAGHPVSHRARPIYRCSAAGRTQTPAQQGKWAVMCRTDRDAAGFVQRQYERSGALHIVHRADHAVRALAAAALLQGDGHAVRVLPRVCGGWGMREVALLPAPIITHTFLGSWKTG